MVLLATTILAMTFGTTAEANRPEGTDQDPIDRFILDCVKRMRVKNVQPQPEFVRDFDIKYTEYCRERVEAEYQKHGRWFYCEDHKEFRDDIRWDECVTYRTYKQLLSSYGSLKKLPNYSEKNHQKAKEFWQKWQRKDGSFYNIFVKEDNGNSSNCNGKYVSMIMKPTGLRKIVSNLRIWRGRGRYREVSRQHESKENESGDLAGLYFTGADRRRENRIYPCS